MSVSYKERALVILVHLYLITYVLSFDWITYIIKAFIKCAPFLNSNQCIEVRFDSFLSGGFTTMAVLNPPERKLAKRTSVQCILLDYLIIGFKGSAFVSTNLSF